jgi:hypothetical protein
MKLDEEFKLFLRWRGFSIDSGLFKLEFNPPQNFASYRQSELDTVRANNFNSIQQYPYISKRFAMERFLGLTEEEMTKNDRLWREENQKEELDQATGKDLRSIGLSMGDISADEDTAETLETPPEAEAGLGPENVAGPVSAAPPGGAPEAGGAAAPAAPATPGGLA